MSKRVVNVDVGSTLKWFSGDTYNVTYIDLYEHELCFSNTYTTFSFLYLKNRFKEFISINNIPTSKIDEVRIVGYNV